MRTGIAESSLATRVWGRRYSFARRQSLIGYVFVSPFVLGVLLWFLAPMLVSVWLAFNEWTMINPPEWVGLRNFQSLFADELFYQSLKVTAYYSLMSVPLSLASSFLVAVLLNGQTRGIAIFRTIYYLPSIVPAVANAVLWVWILNSEYGLLNAILNSFGLPKVKWLQRPEWTIPALVLMRLWSVGRSMVICLAGLQGISQVFYEAADIDGAGRLAKFWKITLPLMSPVLFFNLIMGIIGSFQVFTAGYLITQGGPQNASLFYVLYLYRHAFQYFEMGYAAALAWILFFIIMVLTLLTFRYVGTRVYYEG